MRRQVDFQLPVAGNMQIRVMSIRLSEFGDLIHDPHHFDEVLAQNCARHPFGIIGHLPLWCCAEIARSLFRLDHRHSTLTGQAFLLSQRFSGWFSHAVNFQLERVWQSSTLNRAAHSLPDLVSQLIGIVNRSQSLNDTDSSNADGSSLFIAIEVVAGEALNVSIKDQSD